MSYSANCVLSPCARNLDRQRLSEDLGTIPCLAYWALTACLETRNLT